MLEEAWRVRPDYARRRAGELYGDGISTIVSEALGSATASSSSTLPGSGAVPPPSLCRCQHRQSRP
eukprot:11156270-Lingulodinium_polyedra.AAC.1